MVPTKLLYPPPHTSPKLKLQLPKDFASDESNVDQTIRTMDYDGDFAVMSVGSLVFAGAYAFLVLFGIQ